MSIYKGMLEASVLTISENGEPVMPYYNKLTLDTYIDTYLKENLSKYTSNYSVFTEYTYEQGEFLLNKYSRSVSINLKAKINVFYEYDKTQTFVVRSAESL